MKATPRAILPALAALALLLPQGRALADDQESGISGSPLSATLEAWLYGSALKLTSDSLLNPGNDIAKLPRRQSTADVRLDVRKDFGPFDITLQPRFIQDVHTADSAHWSANGRLRLAQGFIRRKAGGDTFLIGRERLTWGPANFRSPSNPWYFDPGRTDPLALTHGIDLARYTLALGRQRLTAGYVATTEEVPTAGPSRQSAFLKLDRQGESYLTSLIVMQPTEKGDTHNTAPFIGAFAQFTPDDAWVLHAEFGNGRQPYRANPAPDSITLDQPGKRRSVYLLGASYTRENGQLLLAEYLHNEDGFTRRERRAWFDNAAHLRAARPFAPAYVDTALGQMLTVQPRLLGRDYLWLGWQSNPQETDRLWRTELTLNLSDGSGSLLLYGEKSLAPRLSAFAALTGNFGGRRSEYGELVTGQVAVGVKWFVF